MQITRELHIMPWATWTMMSSDCYPIVWTCKQRCIAVKCLSEINRYQRHGQFQIAATWWEPEKRKLVKSFYEGNPAILSDGSIWKTRFFRITTVDGWPQEMTRRHFPNSPLWWPYKTEIYVQWQPCEIILSRKSSSFSRLQHFHDQILHIPASGWQPQRERERYINKQLTIKHMYCKRSDIKVYDNVFSMI